MTTRKDRLTVTVDPDLVAAGNEAVAAGLADSLSGWVNTALRARAQADRRLASLGAAVSDYESEFGEITDEEIAARVREDRAAAVAVRGRRPMTRAATAKRRGHGAA